MRAMSRIYYFLKEHWLRKCCYFSLIHKNELIGNANTSHQSPQIHHIQQGFKMDIPQGGSVILRPLC